METEQSVTTTLARNLLQLRKLRGLTVRSLAARLKELGEPMVPSGITKIEQGVRAVKVEELVALAVALGTTPNRLLLPVDDPGQDVPLTSAVSTTQAQAWHWAMARLPLLVGMSDVEKKTDPQVLVEDFRRRSLPDDERVREDHTAARATRDVLARVYAFLENTDPEVEQDRRLKMRTALARLSAEIDDLIGVRDGVR